MQIKKNIILKISMLSLAMIILLGQATSVAAAPVATPQTETAQEDVDLVITLTGSGGGAV